MAGHNLIETEFMGIPILRVHYSMDYSRLEPHTRPYKRIVVHHAGSKDHALDELIRVHSEKLNFGAVGYHFVIDKEGALYYTRDLTIKGAHAYPNTGKIGIGFLRSFNECEPNHNEISALHNISAALFKVFETNVFGHNQDQIMEIIAKHPEIAKQDEILASLWKPSSREEFSRAKQKLLSCSNQEMHEAIANLKLCPGALAYKGMMQNKPQY